VVTGAGGPAGYGLPVTSASSHTPAYAASDLTTCDREPIHVPGAIQPHGVLIALDTDTMTAVMVSANVGEMLGVEPEDGLGRALSAFVGPEAAVEITLRVREWAPGEPLIVTLPADRPGSLAGHELDVTLHESGSRLVVEMETWGRPRSVMLSYQSARGAMARLSVGRTIDDLVSQLAVEVRVLTGFDRVMVYRFDREWNGEVVAEEKRDDLGSFLGLHYPATDIPAQARRLYTLNWTRLIADVGYAPVHLHPVLDPGTGAPLDLSHSTLRSVSPIHLEYLANMGVGASMSVSLVVDGKLWGLVACHHYSGPHRPSQDARAAAEFLGQVASQQIAERERADAREDALRAQTSLARLTAKVSGADDPLTTLMNDVMLLDLVNASGAALLTRGRYLAVGDTPGRATVERVVAQLLTPPYGEPASTDRLGELVPGVPAAGALALGSSPDSWLVWFRPELPRIVNWGGEPTAKQDQPGVRLSPRKSFDLWREVVSGRSNPWQPWEHDVATRLRTYMNALLLQASREQIAVAESLQRSVLPAAVPSYAEVDVAVRYVPATTYQLGGDWWDAVRLADGRFAFVVGDTAGHGVSVVGAMTQLRAALRAYLSEGAGPGPALDRLDRLMVELVPDQVATAIVAVWDPGTRRLEITSAGHPPALVFVDEDVPVSVSDGRPLLGVGAGEAMSTTLTLPPDAVLLLHTDGLVESRDEDVADALALLRRLGPEAMRSTPEEFVDLVLDACGGIGQDDTTLLAVRLR
jgi:chemotaxis family two-component system sensor kinase Cph1